MLGSRERRRRSESLLRQVFYTLEAIIDIEKTSPIVIVRARGEADRGLKEFDVNRGFE